MSGIVKKVVESLLPWRGAVGPGRLRMLTVMYSDMAGSTDYVQNYGAARLLEKTQRHNKVVLPCIKTHRGQLLRVIGDATQSIFDDPADAARCAIAMQRSVAKDNSKGPANRPEEDEIHIRIGIHFGKAIQYRVGGQTELVGSAPNVGARVEASGGKKTDEILVSDIVAMLLADHPGEFVVVPLGAVPAKGVSHLRVHRLLWRDNTSPAPTAPKPVLAAKATEWAEQADSTRAVHGIFLDVKSGRGQVVPVWVQVRADQGPGIHTPTVCDAVMKAAAKRAIKAAFAALDRLGFEGAVPEQHQVTWWIDGQDARYQGPSLGLAVALATVAAYTGVQVDSRVAVTGSVDGDRVVPVAGVAQKWHALRDSGRFRALMLPGDNLEALPAQARDDPELRLVDVSSVGAAILDLLGPALGLAAGRLAGLLPPPLTRGEAPVAIELWVEPADSQAASQVGPVPAEEAHTWQIGDRVRFLAYVDRDCYLTLACVGATGEVRILISQSAGAETAARAGQPLSFPAGGRDGFELVGPPGRVCVIALASAAPLPWTPQSFEEASPPQGVQPRTRGLGALADQMQDQVLGRREIEFYISSGQEAPPRAPRPEEAPSPVRVRGAGPAPSVRVRGPRTPSAAAEADDVFEALDLG
jgi:class 3 adenylate cyclase